MDEKFSYQDIYNAYRKLKNYYYYDTNTLSIRYQICEFESKMGINAKTTEEELISKLKSSFEPLYNLLNSKEPLAMFDFLGKIGYKILPKETSSQVKQGNYNYISNEFASDPVVIEKCNFIIDAPIEILLISVLWVEYVGVNLSSYIKRENYAYQLNATRDIEDRLCINNGLNMFKPYYIGYQNWRDNALKEANRLLDSGNDVSILSLDIKRYFYSARISLNQMMNIYWDAKLYDRTPQVCLLNELLHKIHQLYSVSLNRMLDSPITEAEQGNGQYLLPVGLPSSGVLGNLLLVEFDENVWEKICPVYYGRYVDDMLFVFANRYVSKDDDDPVTEFVRAYFCETGMLRYKTDSEAFEIIMPKWNASCLEIQKEKVVLEHFLSNGSHAAIDIFLKDLAKQRSEFRFLPDEDYISDEFDKEAYKLFYSDSSQKFRNIQSLKADKFGASKYLAKRIFLAKLAGLDEIDKLKDESKKTGYQLLNFFKGKTALDMYSLWDKVATYYILNNDIAFLSKFYYSIQKEIKQLTLSEKCCVDLDELKENLLELLNHSLAMPLALCPNHIEKERKYFKKIALKTKLRDEAVKFRHANMFKHNYIGLQGINYTACLFDDNSSLFGNSVKSNQFEVHDAICFLSPVFIHFEELNLIDIHDKIMTLVSDGDSESVKSSMDLDLMEIQNRLIRINTKWQKLLKEDKKEDSSWINCFVETHIDASNTEQYVSLSDEKIDQYQVDKRIAIANKQVFEQEYMHVVKRKSGIVNSSRRKALCMIINDAYKEQADMLIMPELTVPFCWLGFLASQVIHTKMAIVTGMEYVVGDRNYILNTVATILPIQTKYGTTCTIHLRIKNFYSPKEKILLEGYHYNIPKIDAPQYTLFHWRKAYFSVYNCFELADIRSRGLFQSKADFLIAVEYNKDIHYFSDVTGSWARDIHCFIVQVNTSQYGDSKIIMPSKSDSKTLLNVKGGDNPVVMVATLPISRLRDFQIADYTVQVNNKEFKFTPPHFNYVNVEKKIRNEELWQM